MENLGNAHLGELMLAIQSREPCVFRYSPAASVHAALMRRLELIDPELSDALHNAREQDRHSYHPWTVSRIAGLVREQDYLLARPDELHRVRITALAPRMIEGLVECFDSDSPLGSEPIHLENIPFDIVFDKSYWANLSTYPSMLNRSKPQSTIHLSFESPTAFASQRARQETTNITPRQCFEGYLRKWNTFSNIAIPEEDVLEFISQNIGVVNAKLKPAWVRFRNRFAPSGAQYVNGVMGRVEWRAAERYGNILRFVNTLADFAFYCGTGANVSRGMGHTVRNRR